jgi:CheY-like chemotaxis protein
MPLGAGSEFPKGTGSAYRYITGEVRALLEELVAAHQQSVQRERLRAFREMAGRVARDFDNTLSSIITQIQFLLANLQDPEVRRSLRTIEQVAIEGAWVARHFQNFSRMHPAHPFQPMDVNQLVTDIARSARSLWGKQLAARAIAGEVRAETVPLPLVSGDLAELRHVLASIALNALDAMPEGGNLTFRTGTDGQRVFCQVADTGVGIPEEVRLHIFDPFFTTKREKGKGFGLSGAYAIVDRHGGEIMVESEVGKGTTVTIWLPVAAECTETAPDSALAAPAVSTPEATPGARILVVDDSVEVCEVLRELLSRHGATVVTCPDGESGLVELERRTFDLAMLDLGLTSSSGLELATRLKRRWPATKVALMTSYEDHMNAEDARAKGIDYVLAKPFSLDQLRSVVDHVSSQGKNRRP